MKKRHNMFGIFLFLAVIILGAAGFIYYRYYSIGTMLAKLSPDKIVEEYFNAVNNHDILSKKQIVFDRNNMYKRFSEVETINIIKIEPFSSGHRVIDGRNYADVSFRVTFEVRFKKNSNDSSMTDGKYSWLFSLVRQNVGEQWRIYDFGI